MEKDREKTDLKVEMKRVQKQMETDFDCTFTYTNNFICGDGDKQTYDHLRFRPGSLLSAGATGPALGRFFAPFLRRRVGLDLFVVPGLFRGHRVVSS